MCYECRWCLAPSAHLLSVYIVKIRFKGGALLRSPLMPTVRLRLRLLPRGRSTNGEQEEESVLPSVRPSVPHQMTPPPPNRPTSLWDFTLRPKVSRSFGPARLNCYNFSVAAVLREKSSVQTFLSVTTASHLGVGALVGNNSRTSVGF